MAHLRRRMPDSGEQLADALRAAGVRCRIAPPRASSSPRRRPTPSRFARKRLRIGQQLLASVRDDAAPERIIYLWNLDAPAEVDDDALMGTDALLHLTQALEATHARRQSCASTSVTRGAQPVGRDDEPDGGRAGSRASACCASFSTNTRTSSAAGSICRRRPPRRMSTLLWSELLRDDAEREVAFRGEARYVQRLDRGRPSSRAVARSGGPTAPRVPRARPPRHAALRAVRAARRAGRAKC